MLKHLGINYLFECRYVFNLEGKGTIVTGSLDTGANVMIAPGNMQARVRSVHAQDIAADKPKGEFVAADLRNRLDNGRKISILILEFFDRHGLTIRKGDICRFNPRRLNLFDPYDRS